MESPREDMQQLQYKMSAKPIKIHEYKRIQEEEEKKKKKNMKLTKIIKN